MKKKIKNNNKKKDLLLWVFLYYYYYLIHYFRLFGFQLLGAILQNVQEQILYMSSFAMSQTTFDIGTQSCEPFIGLVTLNEGMLGNFFAYDGMSLFYLNISLTLTEIMLLGIYEFLQTKKNIKYNLLLLTLLELTLILFFLSKDMILFYVWFEFSSSYIISYVYF